MLCLGLRKVLAELLNLLLIASLITVLSFLSPNFYEIYHLLTFIMKVKKCETLQDFYINASETLEFGAQSKLQGLQNHLAWNV